VILICGWTGYVMVWDVQGEVLAREGARLLDLIPIFSEPISRAFVGERPIPATFFFLNLFLHVTLPIGLGVVLWTHVSRVARAVLLPPRPLMWSVIGLLVVLALLWPIGMAPPADLARMPGPAAFDFFYAFFLPLTRALAPAAVWAAGSGVALALILVPLWSRPRAEARPRPSVVDQRLCTGCEQCYLDCPYEAISMVPRQDQRDSLVAQVNPSRCVSCGICAGSCAPMGVGPPGRTGRDQLSDVRRLVAEQPPGPRQVVVIACSRGAGGFADRPEWQGTPLLAVSCAGNLHTSVIEYLVRSGAGGVLVAACPPRDCWNREGPKWLEQRMYHDREAELQERVDRRRVRLVHAGWAETAVLREQLEAFEHEIRAFDLAEREATVQLDAQCEVPESVEGSTR